MSFLILRTLTRQTKTTRLPCVHARVDAGKQSFVLEHTTAHASRCQYERAHQSSNQLESKDEGAVITQAAPQVLITWSEYSIYLLPPAPAPIDDGRAVRADQYRLGALKRNLRTPITRLVGDLKSRPTPSCTVGWGCHPVAAVPGALPPKEATHGAIN